MYKIWDRNPSKSEVIGRWGGDEKNELLFDPYIEDFLTPVKPCTLKLKFYSSEGAKT